MSDLSVDLLKLPEDTLLYIDFKMRDPWVVDKAEFMASSEYLDYEYEAIYIAMPHYAEFDLYDVISDMADDMCEDWEERVLDDLDSCKGEIESFTKLVNEVLERNPSYYAGKSVWVYREERGR